MYEYYSQCSEFIDQATYSVSGNTLTMIYEDEEGEEDSTIVCTIKTLNNDTLILELYGDKVKLVRDVNLIIN
ncbi:MAG: lipocalin family protein [Flavobacteriaceae bacterium]